MKQLLRKILPPQVISQLKSIRGWVKWRLICFFSMHPRLSGLFYAFFSTAFDKEHVSVLNGRRRYLEIQESSNNRTNPQLRRNVHRLEKGLIMQPRKDVFAQNYISETVTAFLQVKQSQFADRLEIQWSEDILTSYFNTVHFTPVIKQAFDRFSDGVATGPSNKVPYPHKDKPVSDISPDQLKTLFLRRRSTRWFKTQTVESEKLDHAIELALLAPSACNRQPFEFIISQDKAQAVALGELAVGTSGFCDNIPQMIAVVGDLSAYEGERDRHLIYIDSSLATMQLMLGLEVLGLSSCPLNWPEIPWREQAIAKLLKLPAHKRVIMLLAVGYADDEGMIPYSQKKSVEHSRSYF